VPLLQTSDESGGPNRFDVELTLEKGGGYALIVDDVLVGDGFTGGYEGDPRGAPSETIKHSGVETLYVASPLSMQLGCGPDTATLKVFVHDETVIQTELAVHGEATPRIDIGPTATPKAKLAADAEDVRSALAALAGNAAEDLVGDLDAALDEMVNDIARHFVQSGRHQSSDTDNTISDAFLGADTSASRATTLNAIRRALSQHMRNDSGSGVASGDYHSAADWTNLPLDAASPSDALTDGIAQADTWRAYEAHRVSDVHRAVDNTNKLAALPPLLDLHRAFLAALAAASTPAPETGQTAVALLVSRLGFKDA
jgi:hypothetical protein